MTKNTKYFIISILLFISFIIFTLLLRFVDVKPIGPKGTAVGFATFNGWFHSAVGTNITLYNITDWASIAAIVIGIGFAILGLCQLIKRKSLKKVDSSILVLGAFYIIVFCIYILFEFCIINYRPVLIGGYLQASYPSSTTMLVMCFMPTAMMQFSRLIKNNKLKKLINILCGSFTVLMVIGRIISGVHWITDIIGGMLMSSALVMTYFAVNKFIDFQKTL